MRRLEEALLCTGALVWIVVVPTLLVVLMVAAWHGMGDFSDPAAVRENGLTLVLLAGLLTGVAYFSGWSLWRAKSLLRG